MASIRYSLSLRERAGARVVWTAAMKFSIDFVVTVH